MIFKGDRQLTPALTDLLDDTTPSSSKTYSSNKINSENNTLNTAISNEITRATTKENELETNKQDNLTSSNFDKGISLENNKIGHTNNITPPSTGSRFICGILDNEGHFKGTPTGFQYSDVYNSSLDNCLFTRKGANALYTALKYSKSSSVIKIGDGLEIHIERNISIPQSGTTTKNFSTAFPNNCWGVIICPSQPGYGANAVPHAEVVSKSQYKVSQAGGVAAMGATLLAFGN